MNSKSLDVLTITRFLAAIVVVIAHFMQFKILPPNEAFLEITRGGTVSVIYFFTLSGFLLAHNYMNLQTRNDVIKYFINRVSRIFPVLIFAILLSLAVVPFANHSINVYQKEFCPDSSLAGLIAVSGQLTGLGTWFPFSAVQSVLNAPAWSVGCEIFFYLSFPFILRMLGRHNSRKWILFFSSLYLFLIAILVFFLHDVSSNRTNLLIGRSPIIHLLEFVLGIFAYKYIFLGSHGCTKGLIYIIFTFSLALLINLYDDRFHFLFLGGFFSCFISILSSLHLQSNKITNVMIFCGKSSYALYLVHYPIGILLINHNYRIETGILVLFIVFVVSGLVYYFLEKTSQRWLRKFLTLKLGTD